MTKPLFTLPHTLQDTALRAQKLFDAQQFQQAISSSQESIAAVEKQLPARSNTLPPTAEPDSAAFQYYALTVILVNALAELGEWKQAKEALGKYRVRFPRDPWGFTAGAEVTRRDTQVHDKAAVERAIELLEGEAERLQALQ